MSLLPSSCHSGSYSARLYLGLIFRSAWQYSVHQKTNNPDRAEQTFFIILVAIHSWAIRSKCVGTRLYRQCLPIRSTIKLKLKLLDSALQPNFTFEFSWLQYIWKD
jgi:hypothetical protein